MSIDNAIAPDDQQINIAHVAPMPQHEPTHFVNEGTKNFLLFRSVRILLKTLLTKITSLRAYYNSKEFKKYIDDIKKTNDESLAALNRFEQFVIQTQQPTKEEQDTFRIIAEVNTDFALIGYQTPVEDWNDLHNHMANFKAKSFAVVPDEVVDAFMSAPNDSTAGLVELAHRYFPDAPKDRKEAFAVSTRKLFHAWKQLGVEI